MLLPTRLLFSLLVFCLFTGTAPTAHASIDWSSPQTVILCKVKNRSVLSYPVIEEPWRKMLMRKMRENQPLAQKAIAEARRKILDGEIQYHPKAVFLPVATKATHRLVELKLPLEKNIYRRDGSILYPAGTIIEPLKAIKMRRWYLVCTEAQLDDTLDNAIAEAHKSGHLLTILLLRGDVVGTAKRIAREYGGKIKVYMATKGLIERMRVTESPSLIHQEKYKLSIETFTHSKT